MKKFLLIFLSFLVLLSFIFTQKSLSDEYDDITNQIKDLDKARNMSINATKPLESQLNAWKNLIESLKTRVAAIQNDLFVKKKNIDDGYKKLAKQQEILNVTIRNYYIKSHYNSLLTLFLSTNSASEFTKILGYQRANADRDKAIIMNIALTIQDLETKKQNLENEQARLVAIKKDLDEESAKLDKIVSGARAYQAVLSGQIAQLSARQQEILSAKSGTFQTTVGDVPLTDDVASQPNYDPGFSPAFAAFSFGAPHFNGLSQYGAYGRAKFGNQSAEDILKAYYGSIEIKKDYPTSTNICVGDSSSSCTNVDLETYVKRIYEVPNSWGDEDNRGMEALKAQAAAARSYALADMQRRGFICASENCQVYKSENKGGNWEQAVNATPGWVMMSNGKPLWAKYASTAGGYIESYTDSASTGYTTSSFWDAEGGRSGWTSKAWESKAGSPWFYKGWYRTRSGDSCGRNHPWLTGQEMADILNAWVVLVKHGQGDDRITPQGGCWGGNPYSIDELKSRAASLSVGYGSVSGVPVPPTYSDGGYTSEVTFQTDRGSVTVSGKDFYKIFNLRSPAKISLKSTLFSIERK